MPTQLTTLASVKQYLGIAGTADDALLNSLISAASGYIEQWTNRSFSVVDASMSFDGTGGAFAYARVRPVQSVSLVSIDGRDIPVSTGANSSGYYFTEDGIGLRGYRFTRVPGAANVQINYRGGMASVPLEIAQACNEMVAIRYKERDRIGISSKGLAGESTSYTVKDMPDSVKTILGNYKSVVPA